MQHYGLDPTHYASAPAVAQDAMLRLTGARIELISDIVTYRAFEVAVRGGVSMSCLPFASAENKYTRLAMGDTSMEERGNDSYLVSWDENNMYGGAMSKKLPCGEYYWLTPQEVQSFHLLSRLTTA
jgi:hypothetical protein